MLHWIYWILYYFPLLHIPPVFGFEKGKCQGERMRANGWSARAHCEWTKRAEQDAWWINIINMSPVNYIIVCHSKNFHSVYVCVCVFVVCVFKALQLPDVFVSWCFQLLVPLCVKDMTIQRLYMLLPIGKTGRWKQVEWVRSLTDPSQWLTDFYLQTRRRIKPVHALRHHMTTPSL